MAEEDGRAEEEVVGATYSEVEVDVVVGSACLVVVVVVVGEGAAAVVVVVVVSGVEPVPKTQEP